MESSGGHQPWHSLVGFYSRAQDRILSLDDALHDGVSNPQFSVGAPDRVTVELWSSKTTRNRFPVSVNSEGIDMNASPLYLGTSSRTALAGRPPSTPTHQRVWLPLISIQMGH
jgi:hypothetical protein